jgi:HD-GYP domain-containing protein (c-di-GMP phosphodiesterase class II)
VRRLTVNLIEEGMYLARSIKSADGRVLLQAGQRLDERYIKRLRGMGVYIVYVEDKRLDDVIVEDLVRDETRNEGVQLAKHLVKLAGKSISPATINDKTANRISAMTNQIVNEILGNKNLVVNLQDIRTSNDYLYFHSVNVCVLSVILGTVLKLKEEQLNDLGSGGLLHDFGKLVVPDYIAEKAGPLDKDEMEIMRRHPQLGFDALRGNPNVKLLWAHIALQHHEWHNGAGYPRCLKGDDIHLYGKIAGIADVYDALTSERCYRPVPFLPHEAMEFIYASSGTQFDPKIVAAFARNIAIYPLGSTLLLSDGSRGVVIDVNIDCITRPKLRIIEDEDGAVLTDPYEVNLEDELTLFIKKVLA